MIRIWEFSSQSSVCPKHITIYYWDYIIYGVYQEGGACLRSGLRKYVSWSGRSRCNCMLFSRPVNIRNLSTKSHCCRRNIIFFPTKNAVSRASPFLLLWMFTKLFVRQMTVSRGKTMLSPNGLNTPASSLNVSCLCVHKTQAAAPGHHQLYGGSFLANSIFVSSLFTRVAVTINDISLKAQFSLWVWSPAVERVIASDDVSSNAALPAEDDP